MPAQKQNSLKNIYLADDDNDDRSMFIEALFEIDNSISITHAENGKHLMDILSIPLIPLPEIIFMDINMPIQDGFECLEEIRNHNGDLKKVKVVLFTTCTDPKAIDRAFKLGATFYAVKPNSFDALKSFIKEVLQIDWFSPEVDNKKFRLI